MRLPKPFSKGFLQVLRLNGWCRTCSACQVPSRANSWQAQNYFSSNKYSKSSASLTTNEIKSFLQSKNIKAWSGPTCFRCENIFPKVKTTGRPRKNETSTLYVNKTTGNFFCTSSGRSGSWEELRDYLKTATTTTSFEFPVKTNKDDTQKIEDLWNNSLVLNDVSPITREEALGQFNLGSLPLTDLEFHKVRLNKDANSVIVPWFQNTNVIGSGKQSTKGSPMGLKVFSPDKDGARHSEIRQLPISGYYGMLGLSQVSPNSKRIVLTMNEFDAIALNSASSSHKAASLPCGITYLPLDVLPYLEQFSEIVLWFNNSQISWEAARQFAKKLDEKRCLLVRPTAATPNPLEALSKNLDLDEIVSSAVSAEIRNIVSFTDLRGFVKDELMNCDNVCGVKWLRFPKLTEKLKGHRRGELTVVTGPTGSGKTTFMSEYSLDLAMQGVSTLWGSFEIQNVRLLKTLVKQFSRSKLEKQMSDFETVAEKFQMLPMHFMTYNGPQTIKEVIHTMRQAAYVHDIQHIIIDNLQFMMGSMPRNNDRFMVQDLLIGEFRNFATTENIHVTVVIHPRKEDSGLPLQISSIFGTAKATQEADNVLILQQVNRVEGDSFYKHNYIEIVKNRYDGELGNMTIHFDKNSLCMSKPPIVDAAERELSESLEPVNDEQKVKFNGGGIISENEQTLMEQPQWLKNWQNETDGT